MVTVCPAYGEVSVPVPYVPGCEFSGVILETGPGVTGLAPGQPVTGMATGGELRLTASSAARSAFVAASCEHRSLPPRKLHVEIVRRLQRNTARQTLNLAVAYGAFRSALIREQTSSRSDGPVVRPGSSRPVDDG